MKYYKDNSNKVYAFESDGSQDSYIPKSVTPITLIEANTLRTPPSVVPQEVTIRQARLALFNAGLLDQVDTIVAGLSGDEGIKARINWDYATTVTRNNELVVFIAQALSLSSIDVDNLFIAASIL